MKNIHFRIIVNFLFIFLFFFACSDLKNIDVTKDLKFILNYKPADSFIEAQVKDAKTGQLILDKINIEIIGVQAANVINFEGEAKTTYTKKGPSIYLGLRNVMPTVANPVNFKIVIRADGYLTSSREVTLVGVSNAPVEILLVKTSALPVGAAINQSTLNSTAGTGTKQDKVIELQNGQNTTLVEIDKGTIFKDSKGNILTGNLQTTVASFSGESKEAAKSLPGGNFVTLEQGPNGAKDVKTTIFPIAFASIELTDAIGNKVANFNQPIDISFEINANTINPKTKIKYKVGDKTSVFSYNETSAKWTYEKEGTIIQKGDEYYVTFQTNHLTWYAVGEGWGERFAYMPGIDGKLDPPGYTGVRSFYVTLQLTDDLAQVATINSSYISSGFAYDYELYLVGNAVIYGSGYLNLSAATGQKNIYQISFLNIPPITEKLILKVNIDGEIKVFEIKDLSLNVPSYTFETKRKYTKLKTIYPSVNCENDCPIEIKPYNIGIECSFVSIGGQSNLLNSWQYLGSVNYDKSDGKIKLIAYLPDNAEIYVRATSYPEYTKLINTGTTSSFIVPIQLTKDHPLCKCGK